MVVAAVPVGFVIAAALLLLLWAYYYFLQKPLAKLLGGLPVVGGAVAGVVNGAMSGLVHLFQSWAETGVQAATAVVEVVRSITLHVAQDTLSALDAAIGYTQQVAKAAGGLIGDVGARISTVALRVTGVAADLADLAVKVSHQATKLAATIATTIPAAINTAVAAVKAWTRSLVDSTAHALQVGINQLRSWAVQAIDQAKLTLGQAIDNLDAGLRHLVGQVQLGLQSQLQVLGKAIDSLRLDTLGRIGDITKALAPILALALPVAWPALLERIGKMERECVDPVCGAIKPRLDLLNLLADGAMLVAMVELITEATQDPQGAAHNTAAQVGGLVDVVDSVTGPVLGIRL